VQGKPVYYHDADVDPYLPKGCFSSNISAFFAAKPKAPRTRHDLDLENALDAIPGSAVFIRLLMQLFFG